MRQRLDLDDGRPVPGRCPRCRRRGSLAYHEVGTVLWFLVPPICKGRLTAVAGVPVVSCITPGCLWGHVPGSAFQTAIHRAEGIGPDAACEYITGRLTLGP